MELIIVTGLSGGGKTQALRCLEDMGYFCVDNLPCAMVGGFVQLCRDSKPPVEKAAVVVDSRESVFERELQQAHKQLNNLPISFHILYLECRDDVLERRYNESRRPHPLNSDIRAGIQAERELLSFFRDRAEYIIDTSDLKPMELRRKLEEYFGFPEKNDFQLIIESFGYKRGVPLEADMVFDMRFSANPFYEEKLRSLSGQDKPARIHRKGRNVYKLCIANRKHAEAAYTGVYKAGQKKIAGVLWLHRRQAPLCLRGGGDVQKNEGQLFYKAAASRRRHRSQGY